MGRNNDSGTVLYVADLHESNRSLDFVRRLADERKLSLELVHVVDLRHESSRPDSHMSIQFRLEALARRLSSLKGRIAATLLFGSPEAVIGKYARQRNARLIAFRRDDGELTSTYSRVLKQIEKDAGCPVLLCPSE